VGAAGGGVSELVDVLDAFADAIKSVVTSFAIFGAIAVIFIVVAAVVMRRRAKRRAAQQPPTELPRAQTRRDHLPK
jgi:flagellar biosynthesis/type III secretory pathway M-ring protein FliF/YscJ